MLICNRSDYFIHLKFPLFVWGPGSLNRTGSRKHSLKYFTHLFMLICTSVVMIRIPWMHKSMNRITTRRNSTALMLHLLASLHLLKLLLSFFYYNWPQISFKCQHPATSLQWLLSDIKKTNSTFKFRPLRPQRVNKACIFSLSPGFGLGFPSDLNYLNNNTKLDFF